MPCQNMRPSETFILSSSLRRSVRLQFYPFRHITGVSHYRHVPVHMLTHLETRATWKTRLCSLQLRQQMYPILSHPGTQTCRVFSNSSNLFLIPWCEHIPKTSLIEKYYHFCTELLCSSVASFNAPLALHVWRSCCYRWSWGHGTVGHGHRRCNHHLRAPWCQQPWPDHPFCLTKWGLHPPISRFDGASPGKPQGCPWHSHNSRGGVSGRQCAFQVVWFDGNCRFKLLVS